MKNRTAGVTILQENRRSMVVHLWFLGKLFKIGITRLIKCFMIIYINWCVCKCQSAILFIGRRVHAVLVCMRVWCVYTVCHFSCLNLRQGPFVFGGGGLCVPAQKNTQKHNSDSSLALWKSLSGHNCLFSSSSADHLPKDARIKRKPSPSPTTTPHLRLPVLCHRSLIHSCGYR